MLLQCGTTQKYEPCQIVSADVKFQLLIIHWGRKKNSCVSKRQTFEAISRQHEVMNISELEHQFKSLTSGDSVSRIMKFPRKSAVGEHTGL